MRAIWKGTISFGLVTIPVSLYPATRRKELKFRLLRVSDLSPVNSKRVAEADGKEVPWDQIVKGYEYERDKFVVLKDEDFKRVDVEATQTVDIIDFVELGEVEPFALFQTVLTWKWAEAEKKLTFSCARHWLRPGRLRSRKLETAVQLIDSMTCPWEPEKYTA